MKESKQFKQNVKKNMNELSSDEKLLQEKLQMIQNLPSAQKKKFEKVFKRFPKHIQDRAKELLGD